MTNAVAKGFVALLLFSGAGGAQQGVSTVSSLERLAADTAIKRAVPNVTPDLRVVIDPMIVRANEAPSYHDSTSREPSRTRHLAEAFHGRSLPRDSVIDCRAHMCRMRDADVLVTLSEPAIVGDQASVTVTTMVPVLGASTRQVPIETQYRTVIVHLARRGGAWQVVGVEDLGMS